MEKFTSGRVNEAFTQAISENKKGGRAVRGAIIRLFDWVAEKLDAICVRLALAEVDKQVRADIEAGITEE